MASTRSRLEHLNVASLLVIAILSTCVNGFIKPRSFGTSRIHPLWMEEPDQKESTELFLDPTDNSVNGIVNGDSLKAYTSPSVSSDRQSLQQPETPFRENFYILSVSGLVGVLSGLAIVVFKTLIQLIRELCYGVGESSLVVAVGSPKAFLPVVGGLGVALLVFLFGEFAPGLRGTIREVDESALARTRTYIEQESKDTGAGDVENDARKVRPVSQEIGRAVRKTIGSAITLGTGNSLGPEGPAVEAGMAVSRFCGSLQPIEFLFGKLKDYDETVAVKRNRLFLSCGAAAGVAAGFNAPLAGVFFALEIVQGAFPSIDAIEKRKASSSNPSNVDDSIQSRLAVDSINISPILLSSVIAALVVKNLLGNELALSVPPFEFRNPLLELPLYLFLGVLSGILASLFSGAAQTSKAFFDGSLASPLENTPPALKPILGSIFCGCVGIFYPQTLFFGYDTLNALLAANSFPTLQAIQLLVAKLATTTVAAASGLVGGTFAPSLFLGGMLGAAYHNIVCQVSLTLSMSEGTGVDFLSGTPAYAMVGGASVLAALFRAPLTATLLLFECTRNYDVILPLMASAGVASLVADIVEQALEEQRRDDDSVSWGDLAMKETITEDILAVKEKLQSPLR